jgi:ABC-type phosphate/phosphonate transport system permease subunit
VPPRPRSVRSLVTMAVVLAVVVGLHVVAVRETQFSLPELVKGWHGIWGFLFGDPRTAGALPPDVHWAVVGPALGQCVVTFSMGLLGTTLSIPFALLLALLGSRMTSKNIVVYQLARGLMSFFRAVPSFIWGLILYRVDVNVRDSLTLGIVGAGGIGFYITQAIREFQFNIMMTYVLMVLVMVIALDLLSAWLRGRVGQ